HWIHFSRKAGSSPKPLSLFMKMTEDVFRCWLRHPMGEQSLNPFLFAHRYPLEIVCFGQPFAGLFFCTACLTASRQSSSILRYCGFGPGFSLAGQDSDAPS